MDVYVDVSREAEKAIKPRTPLTVAYTTYLKPEIEAFHSARKKLSWKNRKPLTARDRAALEANTTGKKDLLLERLNDAFARADRAQRLDLIQSLDFVLREFSKMHPSVLDYQYRDIWFDDAPKEK